MLKKLFQGLLFITMTVCVTACDKWPFPRETPVAFNATDITGASFGKDFHLVDHTGRPRSMADFKGKVVVLFFGYTHCPDVCPTTMAELAQVMKKLGPDAVKVQVLFVTVDPERDTQALLGKYVPAFNPAFIGLRGDEAATRATAREFKIVYQKVPGSTPDSYSVDHSSGTYVFDPAGRLRLFLSYGTETDAVVHDLKILIAGR